MYDIKGVLMKLLSVLYKLQWLGLMLFLFVPSFAWGVPSSGIANKWVRKHPFTLMGTSIHSSLLDIKEYRGAGFSVLLAWAETPKQTALAAASHFPWQAHLLPADKGPNTWFQYLVTQSMPHAGGQAWLVHDEPNRLQMPNIAKAALWLRQKSPHTLVYGNIFPSYASAQLLYGNTSQPHYAWSTYIDDYLTIIKPDILMYDHYPFETTGGTKKSFFSDLMIARNKAMTANIPYFTFLQSWANAAVNMRLPSESDVRMQAFSHLAAGYSGFAYFIYDYGSGSNGLLNSKGQPTPLYFIVAKLNAEITKLGRCLRFLTSTDVRFLRGKYKKYVITLKNPVPSGLMTWSNGAGGDPHIIDAGVNSSIPAYQGKEKNGLIGFFTDDSKKHYFMLVNLSHAANKTANDTKLALWIQFDHSINSILELDRMTGKTRLVRLQNHRLNVILLGGSGRLYKYKNSAFAPDVALPHEFVTSEPVIFDSGTPDNGTPDNGTLDTYQSEHNKVLEDLKETILETKKIQDKMIMRDQDATRDNVTSQEKSSLIEGQQKDVRKTGCGCYQTNDMTFFPFFLLFLFVVVVFNRAKEGKR